MAYSCPRCGESVKRGTSTTAGLAGGAVGALLYSAFGPFQCKNCGQIPKREFPADVQQRMALGSVAMVATAVGLLIAVIVLLVVLQVWAR